MKDSLIKVTVAFLLSEENNMHYENCNINYYYYYYNN